MKAWEIDELRRGCKGKWAMRGEVARAFNGRICTDSRKATGGAAGGDFFVAIKGERFDAHDFLRDVIGREVAAILVSQAWAGANGAVLLLAREKGVAVIAVEDTVAGLNRLAAAYRSNEVGTGFRAKVIAVGGSNGKTTTKRILHALLAEKFGNGGSGGGGVASPKSFNNNIGMPLTLLEVMPGHDYVVLEIGTNAPGEIGALGAVCRPDVAVITSIGLEHLEKLGDLAGVAREEASIAEHVAEGGMVIVPEVGELMREMALSRVQRVVVGMGDGHVEMANGQLPMTHQGFNDQYLNDKTSRLELTGVEERLDGTAFSINGRGSFFVPLHGAHNAGNALMAIAGARRLGVSDEQVAAGLLKVTAAEGRFEVMRMGGVGEWVVVNDAYNANPSSIEASLRTFVRMGAGGGDRETRRQGDKEKGGANAGGRRVVVLGDMLELGAAAEEMHRRVGELVGELGVEVFVAVGRLMEVAAAEAEIENGKATVVRFGDAGAARAGIRGILRAGDRILLKGSHGMALESLLDTLRG